MTQSVALMQWLQLLSHWPWSLLSPAACDSVLGLVNGQWSPLISLVNHNLDLSYIDVYTQKLSSPRPQTLKSPNPQDPTLTKSNQAHTQIKHKRELVLTLKSCRPPPYSRLGHPPDNFSVFSCLLAGWATPKHGWATPTLGWATLKIGCAT